MNEPQEIRLTVENTKFLRVGDTVGIVYNAVPRKVLWKLFLTGKFRVWYSCMKYPTYKRNEIVAINSPTQITIRRVA